MRASYIFGVTFGQYSDLSFYIPFAFVPDSERDLKVRNEVFFLVTTTPMRNSHLLLTESRSSTKQQSYPLTATTNNTDATFSKQCIHFLRSLR